MKISNKKALPQKENAITSTDLTVSHIANTSYATATILSFNPDKFLAASFMNDSQSLGWIIDENEDLVWANTSFKKYFNLSDDAINNKVPAILPLKVIDGLYEKHVQVLNTLNPIDTIQQVKLADGSNITFQVNLFPVKGIDGKFMIGGQAFHISKKINLSKNSDINKQLLLLRLAGTDAIWEWNMQSGHIFRNDTLMKMIGYPVNETDGLDWWFRRIHPEDRERVNNRVNEAIDKQLLFWEDEYRFQCADGEYKFIHDHGYVVYENGRPVKMIGSLHDVAEIDSLQSQLNNDTLRRQKELSETVIRVQEIERARIGYELHDNINQIISTAKLFVDMFNPLNDQQKQAKGKSIHYLVMAIEEIRKLSKELVTTQFKEKELTASLQKMITDLQASSGIQITFTHDSVADSLSDGKKVVIFRIIQEQLKNIITHSAADKACIFLRGNADTVELVIKDNGKGFNALETRRGIGLSNIYERTKFYNGNAELETKIGEGCKLIIRIPIL
ncbi:MAG: PAS domain-containing protein [Chitinophagaceae bacterium]|nr:PAS domain-containing protein [Chitinophagaceae bacterium]